MFSLFGSSSKGHNGTLYKGIPDADMIGNAID
jgi:hypothetical protein